MKAEVKEKIALADEKQSVTINPELNKYQGQILFPKKLELAEKQLKRLDISKIKFCLYKHINQRYI